METFISKYYLFKIFNWFLRRFFTLFSPNWLVRKAVQKTQVKYLNLGGYVPTENYLTIHLSDIELYGIPTQYTSISVNYDEAQASIKQHTRQLTSPSTSLHYNVLKGLPLDSNSLSGINMSHFFEHFSREDGLKILQECYRVLVPGGILRMSCPDLLVYAKAYVARDAKFYEIPLIRLACLYDGLTTFGDRFISKAYDNDYIYGHKWFYDAESASELLKAASFKDVSERTVHESALPNIEDIEPGYRASESFYVEAVKVVS
jgi:SAM-dependent methyltransferase